MPHHRPSVAQLIDKAAAHFGIAAALITGKSSDLEIRLARLAVWYVARQLGHDLKAISAFFPGYGLPKISNAQNRLPFYLANSDVKGRALVHYYFFWWNVSYCSKSGRFRGAICSVIRSMHGREFTTDDLLPTMTRAQAVQNCAAMVRSGELLRIKPGQKGRHSRRSAIYKFSN